MSFSPETVAHVQRTWATVETIAPVAARLFYEKLFDANPSLRPMFRGDMEAQGAKLMDMIGVAIRKLDRPAALGHMLEALGRRHGTYGVRPEHYNLVGTALLDTLDEGLGDAFTPDVEAAWAVVYGAMASTMIGASEAA